MLVVGFPTGTLEANCYLLAPGPGKECVIVDPGPDAARGVERAREEHGLTPVAVVATHGHIDHVADAATVADTYGIEVRIRPEDRHLLTDPAAGLPTDPVAGLPADPAVLVDPSARTEPARVRALEAGPLEVAGLRLDTDHTPGHTRGSVVFRLTTPEGGHLALTGDTLFAGSVGRTDLPGGDAAALATSLRTALLPLADDTVVLPGHGGSTTIGRERATNPFLTGESA